MLRVPSCFRGSVLARRARSGHPQYSELGMTDKLDETIEESFPASDAPANTPETGIGIAPEEHDDKDEEEDEDDGEMKY